VRIVIAVAAVAAVGAIVGVVYVGQRMAEPTVVADPYEAGLRYDEAHHAHDAAAVGPRAAPACRISSGACARVVGQATVTLEVAPRPVRPMSELVFTVSVSPPEAAGTGGARLALAMPGMTMGDNRVALVPSGPGRWRGGGVLVRCPSGKRIWSAELALPPRSDGQPPVTTTFVFEVSE